MGDAQNNLLAVVIAQVPSGNFCRDYEYADHETKGVQRLDGSLTPDLGISPLLTIADINKIKGCLGLRKTEEKVLDIIFAVDGTIPFHGFAETIEVSNDLSDNFHIFDVFALFCDGLAEGVCCFLAALEALFDVFFLELHSRWCISQVIRRPEG